MKKMPINELIANLYQYVEDQVDVFSFTTKQIDAMLDGIDLALFLTQQYEDGQRRTIIKTLVIKLEEKFSFYESDLII